MSLEEGAVVTVTEEMDEYAWHDWPARSRHNPSRRFRAGTKAEVFCKIRDQMWQLRQGEFSKFAVAFPEDMILRALQHESDK